MTKTKLLAALPVLLFLVAFAYAPTLEYLAYTPYVDPGFPFTRLVLLGVESVLLGLAILIAIVGVIVAVVARKYRKTAFLISAACITVPIAFAISSLPVVMIRQSMLEAAVDRSQPLIAAILDYARKTGKPPETLTELTPSYFKTVPTTGMGAFPAYGYRLGAKVKDLKTKWELGIDLSSEYDKKYLFYWPSQLYPNFEDGQKSGELTLITYDSIRDWRLVEWGAPPFQQTEKEKPAESD